MKIKSSEYKEYKQYICSSLHGIVSDGHIVELKRRIIYGVDTSDELYNNYKELFELKHKEQLMDFKTWFREKRLKNLLD